MNKGFIILTALLCALTLATEDAHARKRTKKRKAAVIMEAPVQRTFTVKDGVMREDVPVQRAMSDSLLRQVLTLPDSLAADSLGISLIELDSLRSIKSRETAAGSARGTGSVLGSSQAADMESEQPEELSRREQKRLDRELRMADSTFVRHNKVFRDSIPISRVTAYSLFLPGYAQVYNSQAWKVPVLYTTVAASVYFGAKQHKIYSKYKSQYDMLTKYKGVSREEIDPIQRQMIKYNTRRQLLFIAAMTSYIYFVGDGVVNYPGAMTSVKKATTLSTIMPGAGQFYNKSYWKVPIVIGGFATMAYVVDWNNRGYKRARTAFNAITDNDPDTHTEFYNEYTQTEPNNAEFYRNLKQSYRRNRDLCIILTAGFYLINIIDAHVDAHLKDYDVSDNLAMTIEPAVFNHTSVKTGRNANLLGFRMSLNF